ncbi:hypothetical protein ACVWWN_003459 [Mycobacterium sp. URHB0021]
MTHRGGLASEFSVTGPISAAYSRLEANKNRSSG